MTTITRQRLTSPQSPALRVAQHSTISCRSLTCPEIPADLPNKGLIAQIRAGKPFERNGTLSEKGVVGVLHEGVGFHDDCRGAIVGALGGGGGVDGPGVGVELLWCQ